MGKISAVWRLLGLGWYIAFFLVIGIGGGVWLDQQTRLAPLFLLLGLAMGLGAGFFGIYRLLQQSREDDARSEL